MSNELDLQFDTDTVAGKLDPAYIETTEKMIGLKFPVDYLEFMKTHNGGVPNRQIFEVDGEERVLQEFLYIVADYKTSEFGELDVGVVWTRIEDRLDGNLIPFASVFAGDYLCFDFADVPAKPKVVLWYAELSDEEGPYLFPVAENFEDFLKILHKPPSAR